MNTNEPTPDRAWQHQIISDAAHTVREHDGTGIVSVFRADDGSVSIGAHTTTGGVDLDLSEEDSAALSHLDEEDIADQIASEAFGRGRG